MTYYATFLRAERALYLKALRTCGETSMTSIFCKQLRITPKITPNLLPRSAQCALRSGGACLPGGLYSSSTVESSCGETAFEVVEDFRDHRRLTNDTNNDTSPLLLSAVLTRQSLQLIRRGSDDENESSEVSSRDDLCCPNMTLITESANSAGVVN